MERTSSARDRYFMRNALNISLRGIGNTWPNPSVGAVVVKNDQIVSRGWTQQGGKPHAEVVALKKNNLWLLDRFDIDSLIQQIFGQVLLMS